MFPDGELHEIGRVVSRIQLAGLEARHVEGLREHYALTLRAWVRNLEASWPHAVAEVGAGRARVWRLYMAASAMNFEAGRTQIHQVLAVRNDHGAGGFPLRRDWRLQGPARRPMITTSPAETGGLVYEPVGVDPSSASIVSPSIQKSRRSETR